LLTPLLLLGNDQRRRELPGFQAGVCLDNIVNQPASVAPKKDAKRAATPAVTGALDP